MEVIHGLEYVKSIPGSSVTVGSFDGVHLGHRRIIRRMQKRGNGPVTVMTFSPHPQLVVRSHAEPPPQLTTFDERLALFEEIGVDRLIIAKFDKKFAEITPEEFIKNILIDTVGMTCIFVGPTHGFGSGRRGDVNLLTELGERFGFEVEVVDPIRRDDGLISSSRIRNSLTTGNAHTARRYLGRPYYLLGKVIVGDRRGKGLGFPTANLEIEHADKLMPPQGIYVTITEVNGKRLPSVSHLGERPTFESAKAAIETHIIGFKEEIYGEPIKVGLVDRLRDIVAFDSIDALVRQMENDRTTASLKLERLGFKTTAHLKSMRLGQIN